MDSALPVAAAARTASPNAAGRSRCDQPADGFDVVLSAADHTAEIRQETGTSARRTGSTVEGRQPRATEGSGAAAPHGRPVQGGGARVNAGTPSALAARSSPDALEEDGPDVAQPGDGEQSATEKDAATDAAEPHGGRCRKRSAAADVTRVALPVVLLPVVTDPQVGGEAGDAATEGLAADVPSGTAPAGAGGDPEANTGVEAAAQGAGEAVPAESLLPQAATGNVATGGVPALTDAAAAGGAARSDEAAAGAVFPLGGAAAAAADVPGSQAGPADPIAGGARELPPGLTTLDVAPSNDGNALGQPPAGDDTESGEVDPTGILPRPLVGPWREPDTASGQLANHHGRQLVSAALAAAGESAASAAVETPAGRTSGDSAAGALARSVAAAGSRFAPVVTAASLVAEAQPAWDGGLPSVAPPVDLLSFAMAGIADARSESQGGGQRGWGGSREGAAGSWPAGLETSAGIEEAAAIASPVFIDSLASSDAAAEAGGTATTRGAASADAPLGRQVVRAISLAWRDGVGEARVRLSPEHLGQVSVALRVEKGVVSAVLQAETPAARDWIQAHESELRQSLEGQGLKLDSLVVTADGESRGRQEPEGRPRRRALRDGNEAPRFEVHA